MATFQESLRYRFGKRVSKLAKPGLQFISINPRVSILTTNPVEYAFPCGKSVSVNLLGEEQSYYLKKTDFELPPSSRHLNARLLQSDRLDILAEKVETADCEAKASDNLFVPLGRRGNKGKRFTEEHEQSEQSLFSDFGLETKQTNKIDGYRKSFKEQRQNQKHVSVKGPDIWDLLIPLLQPPIDQDFVDVLDLPPRCMPYAYQWAGIKFLVERESALLGDDMGTGKTVQSILASRLLFQRGTIQRALIIAPLSVLAQWDRELEKWSPELRTTVIRGSIEHRKVCWSMPAHIWITNYHTLRQDIDHLIETRANQFDLIILDEAQRIKNRTAGVSKAAKKLDATFRWALSGTPIENHLSELASIFAFLKPNLFRNKEILPREASSLIEPYFLRRRREDVLEDLPEKQESPVWIRLGPEQQNSYDSMEKEKILKLHNQGSEITAQNIVTLIGELKKICNRDPLSGKSAKFEWLFDKLPEIFEQENKLLIFTQYRQEQFGGIEWLMRELSEFDPLDYGASPPGHKRDLMLETFEKDSEKRIFLGNPRTAGLGLNQLTAANYVVHFDHWWNPAVTNQATARAHRPKQIKKVFVYHLWVEDTIEEMILQKTLSKQKLYNIVIDSLSAEITEDVLFDVYDDLLVKHGFQPLTKPEKKNGYGTPQEFEEMTAALFSRMGFSAKTTPLSKDGGVDVIALRETGASREKIAIQCKMQKKPVGRPVLQQLLGVLSSDPSYTSGILVTSSDASRDALDMVRENGRLKVINGTELDRLLEKYEVK